MGQYFRKALQDIKNNVFLTAVTVVTVALSVLIVCAFALFFVNASDLIHSWQRGIRIMMYLKPDVTEAKRLEIKYRLKQMDTVAEAVFVSKAEGLEQLRRQMQRQASLLAGLDANPLPDAFEIDLKPRAQTWQQIEQLAGTLQNIGGVDEVVYGQQWLRRFAGVLHLFRIAGYALGTLFFMAAVFFVANTIRLVLYSRQEEVAIMRLVGAEEVFIRTPFYIQGLLQGAIGSLLGLLVLFAIYSLAATNVQESLGMLSFQLRFLPLSFCVGTLGAGMFVGWLGCFLSLKQFMRTVW